MASSLDEVTAIEATAGDSNPAGAEEKRPMGGDVRMDSPIWYLLKIAFIYVLLLLDIFLNSSINSDNYDFIAQNDFWPFLFIVVQASTQVFVFLTLFLLMCGTYFMRVGLPGIILADFKFLIAAQIVYLLLTMVLGVMRLLKLQEVRGSLDPRQLWTLDGFLVVFICQNVAAALYYHQVVSATIRLSDEKYYSRSYLSTIRQLKA